MILKKTMILFLVVLLSSVYIGAADNIPACSDRIFSDDDMACRECSKALKKQEDTDLFMARIDEYKLDHISKKILLGNAAYAELGFKIFIMSKDSRTAMLSGGLKQYFMQDPGALLELFTKMDKIMKAELSSGQIDDKLAKIWDPGENHISCDKSNEQIVENRGQIELLKKYAGALKEGKIKDSAKRIMRILDNYSGRLASEIEDRRFHMGESNMYIATGSLVYLNYETIADGRWYYAAGLDMAAVAGLAYGDNTVFKAVWPYVLYPLFFSYPVYALVEGYIINDTGKVIRGWIGFAFCLFTYGAWKSFDDCKLDEKYENKPGAFNILPVLTTEFSGLSASLIF